MNATQFMTKNAAPALVAAILIAAGASQTVFSAFTISTVPTECESVYGYDAGFGYGYGYDTSTCNPSIGVGLLSGTYVAPKPEVETTMVVPVVTMEDIVVVDVDKDGIPDNIDVDMNNDGIEDDMGSIINLVSRDSTTPIDDQLCKAGAEEFDTESRGGYLYACVNDITTKKDIRTSMFNGVVIRKEFAKMISNYAVNVLGMTPDTTLACDFNDVNGEDGEMKMYIKMACQLGLMGYKGNGIDKAASFTPNEVVTRAQFGTVLSRMLYDNQYDAQVNSRDWYSGHLEALRSKGILRSINNPMMSEVRGYVWIVFERLQN